METGDWSDGGEGVVRCGVATGVVCGGMMLQEVAEAGPFTPY